MSPKTERIEVRAEADKGAGSGGPDLMPAEQFDGLIASLDGADDAPALADIADRPRRFRRA